MEGMIKQWELECSRDTKTKTERERGKDSMLGRKKSGFRGGSSSVENGDLRL